jgi:multidrug efflux system outer membrane protein
MKPRAPNTWRRRRRGNGVVISLISDVMNTYFSLRELDLELEIGQQNNDIARDNLRLIQLRKDRGAANGLEVHQAEQFLYTTTAQIASVERSIAQTEDALNLLLAQAPAKFRAARIWNRSRGAGTARRASIIAARTPPRHPPGRGQPDRGQRPDRRGAGAVLSPDFAHRLLGGQSQPLLHVQRSGAHGVDRAFVADLPIFHAGLRAGVQLTEAPAARDAARYQKTIYGALREVADAHLAAA